MKNTEEDRIRKLKDFSTSELCDGAVFYETMDYQIRPMVNEKKIVGRAFTVELPAGVGGCVPDAILRAERGDILVIAGHGYCQGSYWGGHRSLCAAMRGLEGVVIDGAFRDLEGCREAGIPIYARAVTPGSARKEREGEFNVPVICGGAAVNPGDYIVGDCNGVCVIRPHQLDTVIAKALQKRKAEEQTVQEMKRMGVILPRVLMPEQTKKENENRDGEGVKNGITYY